MRSVSEIVEELRDVVASFDPLKVTGADAIGLVDLLAEAERLCQGGRAVLTPRVLETRAWRDRGYRNPAQWLAASTRGYIADAIRSVETATRLQTLEATRDALVAGELSQTQAAHIAAAAAEAPGSEADLLALAGRVTVAGLKEKCDQFVAAARRDANAAERLHRSRHFRTWRGEDGAVKTSGSFTPDAGSRLRAAVEAEAARLQEEARRVGLIEPMQAFAADALVRLVCGQSAVDAVVHVRVDQAALERGRVQPGEVCDIEGIGPVPLETAERFLTTGVVKALAVTEADVTAVAHLGRTIPARIRTALEERDRTCVVPGCDVARGLEIDHVTPVSEGGLTILENLARMCGVHHALKTYRGWILSGGPGAWSFAPPRRDGPDKSGP